MSDNKKFDAPCHPQTFAHTYEENCQMPNDEQVLEEKIKALGKDVPRITPEHIDGVIVSASYQMLPSGKTMVCEIILKNGFSVRGESSTVDPAGFDEVTGMECSFKDARDKIWAFEGYLLQQKLYEAKEAQQRG